MREDGNKEKEREREKMMRIAIFHSAYDPANSRSQRLQRDLCKVTGCPAARDTALALCTPAYERRGPEAPEENEDRRREGVSRRDARIRPRLVGWQVPRNSPTKLAAK